MYLAMLTIGELLKMGWIDALMPLAAMMHGFTLLDAKCDHIH